MNITTIKKILTKKKDKIPELGKLYDDKYIKVLNDNDLVTKYINNYDIESQIPSTITNIILLSNDKIKVNNVIDKEVALLLYYLVKKFNLRNTLEVGFGFGFSTIAIQNAHLKSNKKFKHTIIDPFERDNFLNMGVTLLKRYNLYKNIELILLSSHRTLPKLLKKSLKYDLILLDGLISVFEVLITDFYYADLLLEKNGIIIFCDNVKLGESEKRSGSDLPSLRSDSGVRLPQIKKAYDFLSTNYKNYESDYLKLTETNLCIFIKN
jgi:predicted O-methyltransferase YrrM